MHIPTSPLLSAPPPGPSSLQYYVPWQQDAPHLTFTLPPSPPNRSPTCMMDCEAEGQQVLQVVVLAGLRLSLRGGRGGGQRGVVRGRRGEHPGHTSRPQIQVTHRPPLSRPQIQVTHRPPLSLSPRLLPSPLPCSNPPTSRSHIQVTHPGYTCAQFARLYSSLPAFCLPFRYSNPPLTCRISLLALSSRMKRAMDSWAMAMSLMKRAVLAVSLRLCTKMRTWRGGGERE